MELKFKLKDRVRLTESAIAKYGDQSNGLAGTIVFAGERNNDLTRPYLVVWDKQGTSYNSYSEDDLKPAGFEFKIVGIEDEIPAYRQDQSRMFMKAMFPVEIMDARKIVTIQKETALDIKIEEKTEDADQP